MAVGVGADARPGDQVRQQGAHRRVADQHRHVPGRRCRPGRLEQQDGRQVAADEQQPGDAAEAVVLRQRLDGLHRQGPVELLGRVLERGFQLHTPEEALRGDDDQHVAGLTGQVGAVELALPDRLHRRGLIRVAAGIQRHLRGHGVHDRGRSGHPERRVAQHEQLKRTDQAEREKALQDENDPQRDQGLPRHALTCRPALPRLPYASPGPPSSAAAARTGPPITAKKLHIAPIHERYSLSVRRSWRRWARPCPDTVQVTGDMAWWCPSREVRTRYGRHSTGCQPQLNTARLE